MARTDVQYVFVIDGSATAAILRSTGAPERLRDEDVEHVKHLMLEAMERIPADQVSPELVERMLAGVMFPERAPRIAGLACPNGRSAVGSARRAGYGNGPGSAESGFCQGIRRPEVGRVGPSIRRGPPSDDRGWNPGHTRFGELAGRILDGCARPEAGGPVASAVDGHIAASDRAPGTAQRDR